MSTKLKFTDSRTCLSAFVSLEFCFFFYFYLRILSENQLTKLFLTEFNKEIARDVQKPGTIKRNPDNNGNSI